MGCAVSGLTWLCFRVEEHESLENSSELCDIAYPSWAWGPFERFLPISERQGSCLDGFWRAHMPQLAKILPCWPEGFY